MTTCIRCGRTLKAPTPTGMGPVCARAVLGVKPRRERSEGVPVKRDDRTRDMFEGAVCVS